MINRKDDYAVFFNPQLSPVPSVCVCANRSVAKGQIRASPGRENAPQHLSFDPHPPLHTRQCISVFASSGICFSAIWVSFRAHKCADKNQSPFLRSPLRMFSLGSRETQMRPLQSALADCEMVCNCLPTLELSSVLLFVLLLC